MVIEKPSGITSVPYERKETGTALDLIRASWKRAGKRATVTPLYTVHRIDKDTSGLLAFAKTKLAERALHEVFQRHTAARAYLAVAEGDVTAARIESQLVADRGDGIRGSTRHPNQQVSWPSPTWNRSGTTRANRPGRPGEPARSSLHFVACDSRPDERIRSASTSPSAAIPLVGETVYIRDLLRDGRQPLPAPRLMLHAALLGFPHPVTGAPISLQAAPPEDFMKVIESLGGARGDCRI